MQPFKKVATEILSNMQLTRTGDKLGANEATVLNIPPFSLGLII